MTEENVVTAVARDVLKQWGQGRMVPPEQVLDLARLASMGVSAGMQTAGIPYEAVQTAVHEFEGLIIHDGEPLHEECHEMIRMHLLNMLEATRMHLGETDAKFSGSAMLCVEGVASLLFCAFGAGLEVGMHAERDS